MFKGYEFNIKIARVQLLQLKIGSCGGGGGGLPLGGEFFQVGERIGMSKFLTGGSGTPPIPSNSEKPNQTWLNRAKY